MTGSTTYLPDADADAPKRPDRRRTALVIVAGTVLVAVLATWLVAFSSVFGVHTVTVRGTSVLTAAQVRAAAALSDGTPLVRVDTIAVARRVEKLAEVASAQVSTSFPTTVVITVTERRPVGYVRVSGRTLLVDRTGDQYRSVRTVPAGLPKFVVPAGADARTTGGAVATVAAALPAALRRKVRSIQALDPNAITLVLTGDRVVRWGTAKRSPDKARLLPALLKHHTRQVDLSDPDQPFTR
jgi:cell division protein FtsQ